MAESFNEEEFENRLIEKGKTFGYEGEELEKYVEKRLKDAIERNERSKEREAEKEAREQALRLEEIKLKNEIERSRLRQEELDKEIELEKSRNGRKAEISSPTSSSDCKMPNFNEKADDMDAYLDKFELLAEIHKWHKDTWLQRLATKLTGKADVILSSMDREEVKSYDKVKSRLLNAFLCNAPGFRTKFRTTIPVKSEGIHTYVSNITRYFDRWLSLSGVDVSNAGQIIDFMIMEQTLESTHPELSAHIRQGNPKSCKELVEIAERYSNARPEMPIAKSKVKDEPFYSANAFSGQREMNSVRGGQRGRCKERPR